MSTLTNNNQSHNVLYPNMFPHDHERYDDIRQGFFEAMRDMYRYENMDSVQDNEQWSMEL